ncbi:MAG TPA: lysylphosphatidylglycerol synthase transmembrane domain-containing protein [Gemmatimonadales bacterium]|nr:lysylphosphatidylglycerol synthase transmembrane domain-containing protein [Gemmatimonadales bacterium]
MTALEAHLICVGLVAADLIARAWRIQWIIQGLGYPLSLKDAFVLNAFGDAACALTPLRIGGEPARLAGMLRSRVPATAAFVGISLEVLAAWPVIIIAAAWLGWEYAPAWWSSAGPRLEAAAEQAWPWVVGVFLLSVLSWHYARGVTSPVARHLRRPVKRARVYWRRMPWWPLVVSFPLSLVNLGTRVAILPVLALTLPDPPAMGPMLLGSFALLYSQLLLPTPSGAGAVELGFLGGAAGDLGENQGWLLLAWRWYTNGVGVVLGVWLAAKIYGWPALRKLARQGAADVREQLES